MEPKVLIVGTDINAYYMARCYHEIYHKKVDLIGRVAMSFTSLSTITNVNIAAKPIPPSNSQKLNLTPAMSNSENKKLYDAVPKSINFIATL